MNKVFLVLILTILEVFPRTALGKLQRFRGANERGQFNQLDKNKQKTLDFLIKKIIKDRKHESRMVVPDSKLSSSDIEETDETLSSHDSNENFADFNNSPTEPRRKIKVYIITIKNNSSPGFSVDQEFSRSSIDGKKQILRSWDSYSKHHKRWVLRSTYPPKKNTKGKYYSDEIESSKKIGRPTQHNTKKDITKLVTPAKYEEEYTESTTHAYDPNKHQHHTTLKENEENSKEHTTNAYDDEYTKHTNIAFSEEKNTERIPNAYDDEEPKQPTTLANDEEKYTEHTVLAYDDEEQKQFITLPEDEEDSKQSTTFANDEEMFTERTIVTYDDEEQKQSITLAEDEEYSELFANDEGKYTEHTLVASDDEEQKQHITLADNEENSEQPVILANDDEDSTQPITFANDDEEQKQSITLAEDEADSKESTIFANDEEKYTENTLVASDDEEQKQHITLAEDEENSEQPVILVNDEEDSTQPTTFANDDEEQKQSITLAEDVGDSKESTTFANDEEKYSENTLVANDEEEKEQHITLAEDEEYTEHTTHSNDINKDVNNVVSELKNNVNELRLSPANNVDLTRLRLNNEDQKHTDKSRIKGDKQLKWYENIKQSIKRWYLRGFKNSNNRGHTSKPSRYNTEDFPKHFLRNGENDAKIKYALRSKFNKRDEEDDESSGLDIEIQTEHVDGSEKREIGSANKKPSKSKNVLQKNEKIKRNSDRTRDKNKGNKHEKKLKDANIHNNDLNLSIEKAKTSDIRKIASISEEDKKYLTSKAESEETPHLEVEDENKNIEERSPRHSESKEFSSNSDGLLSKILRLQPNAVKMIMNLFS